jgi:hypothetical protein
VGGGGITAGAKGAEAGEKGAKGAEPAGAVTLGGPADPAAAAVRAVTFKGACMLADISGFSKFSGAMCSKGVTGTHMHSYTY